MPLVLIIRATGISPVIIRHLVVYEWVNEAFIHYMEEEYWGIEK